MRIDEIVNHVFTRSFMGYDIEQVDGFLDEVIETMERNDAEKREMLAAMEYLMKQLEHGKKIPLADMKKAIDSGRSQQKQSQGDALREDEQKTARSIARGNGTGKTMRAPKINRVKGEEEAKAQIIEEAKAAIPMQELTPDEADKRAKRMSSAAVNWLDELLINIAEHETIDYDKPLQAQAAQQPQAESAAQANSEPETAAAQPPESNS
jgi:DivIVA domain-containing protein